MTSWEIFAVLKSLCSSEPPATASAGVTPKQTLLHLTLPRRIIISHAPPRKGEPVCGGRSTHKSRSRPTSPTLRVRSLAVAGYSSRSLAGAGIRTLVGYQVFLQGGAMYIDPRIIASLIDGLGRPIVEALANQFISRPDHSVPLEDFEADIQNLYRAQIRNDIRFNEINELLRLFLAAVERSDGLVVRNQRIIFREDGSVSRPWHCHDASG